MEIQGDDFKIRNKVSPEKVKGPNVKSNPTDPTSTSSSRASTGGGEQIAFSAKAQTIQKALDVAKTSPDVRTEKVNRIKSEVDNGTFHVDSEVLAESILKEILTESKFLE
ncbi:putative Anti-sigma-28 factor, FlgM [Nitrospina gracilis 3/211]|uniref:Negative regulator of flagellin synthesis n=1 Tax=Nitrospina gracilis (strain 3/211) TaxID=1266370 RepID=M1YZL8_NITG3|nr:MULTISPECIES: flagellar biosynthesis anti-sigma factor FlgM [Nitrospina]MCF8723833.1 negative regulator of flagellin synthesis FlgM [Nitrospina sp. Nb-3]CCQ90951.1 putative Anti-sigma-28 factor, FlgM [Nitrospina gracilis 3/211]